MTTQIPTWREHSPGHSGGDQATPGTVVGERYELRTPVGHGGMGTVWRATDTLLRRDVAVKEVLLPATMPRNERDALCERTLREARAAAALTHPSVVQVYDVVIDGGRPWIVMELLEARSLADIVIDDGPLPPRAVAKIGIAMLGALEVAHAAGVLHRDVKPANVLICSDGRCVLTDFGVARMPTESKLTTPGMVLGSPHFISPERAVGGPFGPPSDLFSLGVTLYTAVEGGPPFDRGDPFETMRAVVEEPPRPARLAGQLQPVLWGLLDKDPARRWGVNQARAYLREMLSGPSGRSLARGQDGTHEDVTEAPVSSPGPVRPPSGPAPGVARPSRVGGRAMLDPDEPLTGQLARLRGRAGDPRPGPVPLPGTDEWQPAEPVPGQSRPGPLAPGGGRRSPGGTRRAQGRRAAVVDGVAARVRTLGQRAPQRVRALGRKARRPQNRSGLLVAGGLTGLVVVALAAALIGGFGMFGGSPPAKPPASATVAASDIPLIPVQEYRDRRGIVVNVPEGWIRSSASSFVDFTDPDAEDVRKVRINVETTSRTAQRFLQGAESGLRNPSFCPAPYERVSLREAELAGRAGAELEYTCGTGAQMRHGIWRAVVVDGLAYHFYLTVPDTQFADSKIIFAEMVRSFRLIL